MKLRQEDGARVGLWAAVIVVAALAGLTASSVEAQPSPCGGENPPCENWMSVGGASGVPVGDTVDIYLSIDDAWTPYQGFNAVIEYESAVALFSSVGWIWGDPCLIIECWDDVDVGGGLRRTSVQGSIVSGITMDTGVVALVRYQCVGPGATTLRLVPPTGGPWTGTTTYDGSGGVIPTGLTAGSVICQAPAPTPTDTPTTTPTATPTMTPTPTPGTVGGIAEFAPVAGASPDESRSGDQSAARSAKFYGGLAASVCGVVAAIAAGAWYGRRDRLQER